MPRHRSRRYSLHYADITSVHKTAHYSYVFTDLNIYLLSNSRGADEKKPSRVEIPVAPSTRYFRGFFKSDARNVDCGPGNTIYFTDKDDQLLRLTHSDEMDGSFSKTVMMKSCESFCLNRRRSHFIGLTAYGVVLRKGVDSRLASQSKAMEGGKSYTAVGQARWYVVVARSHVPRGGEKSCTEVLLLGLGLEEVAGLTVETPAIMNSSGRMGLLGDIGHNKHYSNPVKRMVMLRRKHCVYVLVVHEKDCIELLYVRKKEISLLDSLDQHRRVSDVLIDEWKVLKLYFVVPKYSLIEYVVSLKL